MTYKGIEWTDSDSDLKRWAYLQHRGNTSVYLSVFPDIIGEGWSYEVSYSCGYPYDIDTTLKGYHFDTEEKAMREAIFDAVVLKVRDSN